MKKSELNKLIKENISNILKEENLLKKLENKIVKSIELEPELKITFKDGDILRAFVMDQGDTGLTYTLNDEIIS